MKKNFFMLIPVIAMVFFLSSCSKNDDNTNTGNSTPAGTSWSGTGQYGTSAGVPTYAFRLTFKANGTIDITGNNNAAVDVATGTWSMVADSVRAFYKYASSSAQYTLSGKYSASSNVMAGTIGLGTATTGVGLFSVTKE